MNFEKLFKMTIFPELNHIYDRTLNSKLKLRPKFDVYDILELDS